MGGKGASRERMLEIQKKRQSVGVPGPRFKKVNIKKETNKVMLAFLYANNIKIYELADYIDVSVDTVGLWVYRGGIPKLLFRKKICDTLGLTEEELFGEHTFNEVTSIPEIDIAKSLKYSTMVTPGIGTPFKKILYGLLWIYSITPQRLSEILKVDGATVRRWINSERTPPVEYIKLLEELFQIPYYILLKNFPERIILKDKKLVE